MKGEKRALVPRLRFPEFRDAGEWNSDLLKSLVTTVTPPKKLTSDQYENEGLFPVIDQSQDYICGWTNDENALVPVESPLIVFGDHTCVLKIICQSFVQGADGIKILKSRDKIEPEFLYQYLLFAPVKMESYKRHFSTLKERLVVYPDKNTGEQQKIADCLSSLDALIAAQADKIDALKTHKKGLMQQLFPREGETVPRLRFPEFRDAGEWKVGTIGDVADVLSGGTPNRSEAEYWNGDIPWVSTSLIDFGTIEFANEYITREGLDNSSAKVVPKGTVLMAMYGQGKTRGKVAVLGIDAAINQACAAISAKDAVLSEFVFQNLAGRYDEIRKISNAGGQENLSGALIKNISFKYPSIESGEQQSIVESLTSLDNLIAAHTQKLKALKSHKKGLMQQLFPVAECVA